MRRRKLFLAGAAVIVGALSLVVACSPTVPDPPPLPTSSVTVNIPGDGNVVIPGNGNVINPAPSPSGSPTAGDNVVKSFAIFCYGFGTVPPQTEPNHDACALPAGYPDISVTASPKNAAGVDVPSPGDKTSPDVIDWALGVSPVGAATLVIEADNRFNARVVPASPRVAANFTLVATYHDPQGNVRVATKSGGLQ